MRQKDAEWLRNKHEEIVKEADLALKAAQEKDFKERVSPVMNELKMMLGSNNILSDTSLESIAKWKLGMQ